MSIYDEIKVCISIKSVDVPSCRKNLARLEAMVLRGGAASAIRKDFNLVRPCLRSSTVILTQRALHVGITSKLSLKQRNDLISTQYRR